MIASALQWIGPAAAFLTGVLASALFAGMETGVYVLNKVRLELRTARGDHSAGRLSRALGRPQEMLGALLIANNASLYVVTALTVVLFTRAGSGNPQLYTTMVVTPLLFVLGEMLPKNLFRVAGETLTYRLSWLLTGLMFVCRWLGLSLLITGLSRVILAMMPGRPVGAPKALEPGQRVRAFLSEGHAHGVLSGDQAEIALRVVGLRSTTVRDVMIPATHVVSVPLDCTRERFMEVLAGHNFSRLVVWRGKPSIIVGVVNVYDVLYDIDETATPAKHMAKPIGLQQTISVAEALLTLQRARRSIGVVNDARGKFVGIVTIKDLVEEIVGELEAW